ncbi:MAG: InlB B-repeat-containing protein [Erysipelotrichales bacterium]|nr:InlB B-repeat-containing protein [Erysipelotrichales bacterium]
MDSIFSNQKLIAIVTGAIFLVSAIYLVFFGGVKKEKESETPLHKTDAHTMIINDTFVKIEFNEEYDLCKKTVCSDIQTEVTSVEILNEEHKGFYKDINFDEMSLYDALVLILDTAKDNNVALASLAILTDSKNVTEEKVKEYLDSNANNVIDYPITVTYQEKIGDEKEKDDEPEVQEPEVEGQEVEVPEGETFTVTFDTVGGSTIKPQTVKKAEKATKPTDPTKKGYTFVEWQLNGKKFEFSTTIWNDITLKAVWKSASETDATTTTTKAASQGSSSNQTTGDNNQGENNNTQTEAGDNTGNGNPTPEVREGTINLNDNVTYTTKRMVYSCQGCFTEEILKQLENDKSKGISYDTSSNNNSVFYRTITLSDPYNTSSYRGPGGNFESILRNAGATGEVSNIGGTKLTLDETVCSNYHLSCDRW